MQSVPKAGGLVESLKALMTKCRRICLVYRAINKTCKQFFSLSPWVMVVPRKPTRHFKLLVYLARILCILWKVINFFHLYPYPPLPSFPPSSSCIFLYSSIYSSVFSFEFSISLPLSPPLSLSHSLSVFFCFFGRAVLLLRLRPVRVLKRKCSRVDQFNI